jgi:hypothetical protein
MLVGEQLRQLRMAGRSRAVRLGEHHLEPGPSFGNPALAPANPGNSMAAAIMDLAHGVQIAVGVLNRCHQHGQRLQGGRVLDKGLAVDLGFAMQPTTPKKHARISAGANGRDR